MQYAYIYALYKRYSNKSVRIDLQCQWPMQRFKRPTCETVFYSIARRNCPVVCDRRRQRAPRHDVCMRTLCLQSILDLTQVLWPTVLTYSWKSLVTSDMNTRHKRYFPSLSLIKKIENKPRISMSNNQWYFFLPNYISCQCLL